MGGEETGAGLADSLVGRQGSVQGILERLVRPLASKHGGNVEGLVVEEGKEEHGQRCDLINQQVLPFYGGDGEPTHHPVGSQGPLDVARQHVGRMMPVVRNAGQPGVDGQQNQEELQRRPQQPSPPPCQPRLQVKLGGKNRKKEKENKRC